MEEIQESEFDPKQKEIYKGLKEFDAEVAAFYKDGVFLSKIGHLQTTPNLLAHASREIDSRIRQKFGHVEPVQVTTGETSKRKKNERSGLIESILFFLGESEESSFAVEWKNVAEQFHRFAHGRRLYNSSEQKQKVLELWSEYENILHKLVGGYLYLEKRVERIIQMESPTPEVIDSLSSLLSVDARQLFFFQNLRNPNWLKPLYEAGFFASESAPSPIKVENGFRIPRWNPLIYLENLSKEIKEGKHYDLVPLILEIIQNVSTRHKTKRDLDNDWIWASFIRILINIPNELIPIEILGFIPTWMDTNWDPLYVSADLVQQFLPKFFPENPIAEDILKAEKILSLIMQLKVVEVNPPEFFRPLSNIKHKAIIYMHWLESTLDKGIGDQIGKYCSKELILGVASNLYQAAKDETRITYAEFTTPKGKYQLAGNLSLTEESAMISINESDESFSLGKPIASQKFENINSISKESFNQKVIESFSFLNIDLTESTDIDSASERVIKSFFDFDFSGSLSIENLNDEYFGSDLEKNFAHFLIIVLNSKAKYDIDSLKEIVTKFLEPKFRTPFFRKLAVYLIGNNWNECKEMFWKYIDTKDTQGWFSSYYLEKDVEYLLKKNASNLNSNEIEILNSIIVHGPKDGDHQYDDQWRLKWYYFLKDIAPFTDLHNEYSLKLGISDERFEKSSFSDVRIGHITPFTAEEILSMSNGEIVNRIIEFHPKNEWGDEPEIAGFSQAIGQAVREDPSHFENELMLYYKVYYPYVYEMLRGFEEAWKGNKSFNWEAVLIFCYEYITQADFRNGRLAVENDSWNVKETWIKGIIGNLITVGASNDAHAFELKSLPLAKRILTLLISDLPPEGNQKEITSDYPTYSLNTTSGKLIRAFLDCCLKDARSKFNEKDLEKIKWADADREILIVCMEKNILDIFIITGMYFRQFYFLDKFWLMVGIKNILEAEDYYWRAFMSGFIFGHPVGGKEVYDGMKGHFFRAIATGETFGYFSYSGLGRHILHFVIWGYERVGADNLITELITKGSVEQVKDLLHHAWQIGDRVHFKNNSDYVVYRQQIVVLWRMILQRFKNTNNEDEKKLLSSLTQLLAIFDSLDDEVLSLLHETSPYLQHGFPEYYLFEQFNRLKNKGDLKKISKSIGELFMEILKTSAPDYKAEDIRDLIQFIYEQNTPDLKSLADNICHRYGELGKSFLKDIFEQYN